MGIHKLSLSGHFVPPSLRNAPLKFIPLAKNEVRLPKAEKIV
jgi:hypothetical protein